MCSSDFATIIALLRQQCLPLERHPIRGSELHKASVLCVPSLLGAVL